MKKKTKLNVLGVMTGTSMDGVDISLIKTNGTNYVKIKCEKSYKFNKNYFIYFYRRVNYFCLWYCPFI